MFTVILYWVLIFRIVESREIGQGTLGLNFVTSSQREVNMGDHFVLLVDRLLTESTLEAAIESRNRLKEATPPEINSTKVDCSYHKIDFDDLSPRKLVECRICQDEDFDSNMEAPCSCCGSLKVC